jgi:hypothetical protein
MPVRNTINDHPTHDGSYTIETEVYTKSKV